MARIVHIALKVDDLEKATKFYEDVFGIYQLKTGYARGHTSRHMMYQASIVRFDQKTETFKVWSIPKEWDTEGAQFGHLAVNGTHALGLAASRVLVNAVDALRRLRNRCESIVA